MDYFDGLPYHMVFIFFRSRLDRGRHYDNQARVIVFQKVGAKGSYSDSDRNDTAPCGLRPVVLILAILATMLNLWKKTAKWKQECEH